MRTSSWAELVPVQPKPYKHANKSLCLASEDEDKSSTPTATPGSTLLRVTTQHSVEQKTVTVTENYETFHKLFLQVLQMIIFLSAIFDGLLFCLRFDNWCQLSAALRSRGGIEKLQD